MATNSVEVAVVAAATPPNEREYKASHYCKKCKDGYQILIYMWQDGAKIWTFDELAERSGLSADFCRRAIYSMCQTTPQLVMEVQGGWMLAHSIRRLHTNFISSLNNAALVAERQKATASVGGF